MNEHNKHQWDEPIDHEQFISTIKSILKPGAKVVIFGTLMNTPDDAFDEWERNGFEILMMPVEVKEALVK